MCNFWPCSITCGAPGFQRVYARTDPANSESVEVMPRLGMTHESTTETMIVRVPRRP
jgi:RimJ/RimL family protein N-acetyltransferase